MKKITFKEYYESKEQLLKASNNYPTTIIEYVVKKYCKLPILDENSVKNYISLKVKDTIKILWEFRDMNSPQPKTIEFENTKYSPSWNDDKIKDWISSTTLEKGK